MFIKLTGALDSADKSWYSQLTEKFGGVVYAMSIEDALLCAYMTGDEDDIDMYKDSIEVGYKVIVPTHSSQPVGGVWWLQEGEYEVVSYGTDYR